MLAIECSNCKKQVSPAFIIDIREISCPDCSAVMHPKNVFISAGPYNIYRDALLKNLHRYKQLLADAEREMAELKTSDSRNAESAARNANKLIYHLKELFSGIPDHQRHRLTGEARVEFRINNRDFHGKLVNISLSGACIGDSNASFIIASTQLELTLPDLQKEPMKIQGKVVWTTRKGLLGIKFMNADGRKDEIRNYISRNGVKVKTKRSA